MKKTKNLVALGLIVSTVTLNASVTQANAQEKINDEQETTINDDSNENAEKSESTTIDTNTAEMNLDNSNTNSSIKRVSVKNAVVHSDSNVSVNKNSLPKKDNGTDDFVAHLYVHTSSGVKTMVITEEDNSILNELDKSGVNPNNLKVASGESIDLTDSTSLRNGDSLVLFANHYSSNIEEVEMEIPVKYVDDNTLFEGEEKVESEGKTGLALETTVLTRNLSLNEDINAKASEATQNEAVLRNSEVTLTVLDAPQAKVIKRGTLERPEELREFVSASSSLASTINNTVTTVGHIGEGTVGKSYSSEISELQSKTQNKAVELALAQVGKPYIWGAVGESAFDCSGLIYWVYKTQLGKNIPRVAGDQGAFGKPVAWSDIQPGDLIWKNNDHIGMYAGEGKMVHASTPTRGVVIDGIDWAKNDGFKVARFD